MRNNILLFTLLLFGLIFNSPAQVVINEYSASNLNSFTDNFGRTEDWIELYNTSSSAVDLSGWHLSDKANNPEKWEIPAGTMIPGNGFLVFLCSGRDGFLKNEYHTNFKLTQTKGSDIVLLADANGNVIEQFSLQLTLVEHSRCRVTDGAINWVVSTAPSFGSSNNNTPQVNGYTQTPSIDLAAGYYSGNQTVTITNNEPNSVVRYTIDGTNPTNNSPVYSTPLTITQTQVIKAQAFSNDPAILPGKMEFNTYFIDEDFTLAVFSVAADDVIDLANGNGQLIPIGSLEYFDTTKTRVATAFGSLNRHGQDSWVLDHRSLDWVTRDEMGYSKAVDAPLFSYSDRDEYQKFMFRNSGDDNYPAINDGDHDGSTHIRDEYVQTLAQVGKMKLDLRAVERVIVFLNGQYWGVYGMRERPVDHDYTKEYYDQGKYDIQYLSTWGTTEIEYGGIKAIADWENLRNFILRNDMSDSANYQIAKDSINMTSLIDYMLMNLNVVAIDWLNYNTGWWRGLNPDGDHKKWGYILWDLDATFDYYINYTGVPNTTPDAEPCDLEEIGASMDFFFGTDTTNHGDTSRNSLTCLTITNGSSPYPATDSIFQQVVAFQPSCCDSAWTGDCQGIYDFIALNGGFFDDGYVGNVGSHEKIFLKLLAESPEFKQLYYTRYADLMNTVFTCENMNTILDSMLDVIRPEMPRQIQRWGGSMTEWEANVTALKGFINERCTLLDSVALNCYNELSGPYEVTLMAQPDTVGEIDFNSLDIEQFPWSGEYFGGVQNTIKARVFNRYDEKFTFSHWVSKSGNTIFPDSTERRTSIELNQSDTLIAVFKELWATDIKDIDTRYNFNVFPNPTSNQLTLEYELEKTENVQVELYSITGSQIASFPQASGLKYLGKHKINLSLRNKGLTDGLYFLKVRLNDQEKNFKITYIRH